MFNWIFYTKNTTKVYVCAIVLFFAPVFAYAASLSASPSIGMYEVGDRVSVRVLASSNESLNAISGVLSFPTSYFTIESVSKNASILNFWVTEPTFSKGAGTAKFEGVALSGFSGSGGTVVTVTLRALKAGQASVTFQSGQVLANDGQGTDITNGLNGASYTIVEAKEKSKVVEPAVIEKQDVPQVTPTLRPPVITQGTLEGRPAILGTSDYSNAKVLLTFLSEDGTKIFITGDSKDNGSFALHIPRLIKRGYYSVSAVVVKNDGTNSEISNSVLLVVGSIFSDIGWQFWWLLILLILIIIYLIVRTHIHFTSDKKVKKVNTNELKQARDVLRKSFDVLQEDVDAQKNDKLSVEGRKHLSVLQKDLREAEDVIDKEIKDIESI